MLLGHGVPLGHGVLLKLEISVYMLTFLCGGDQEDEPHPPSVMSFVMAIRLFVHVLAMISVQQTGSNSKPGLF